MAAINGLALGFRSDANVRVHKFTVMVKSTANTSNQKTQYAAVPAAQNAAGILGVLAEHFVEPNFFVSQGTDPTTVTGTTPTLYNMQNRGMSVQVNGVARGIAAAAIAQMHLSRFAEEIVIWCSDGFGFVALSDAFTTGSSIMPQKRNPDAAELVRGKTGTLYGALVALLTVMKGLPLAYQKDMQEDKAPVFAAVDALELSLAAAAGMVRDMQPVPERLRAAAERGYATATDLADWLVRRLGLPFRHAHQVTGMIVKRAEALGLSLAELPLAELTAIEPKISREVYEVLDIDRSVASRASLGGTAPERVRAAAAEARRRFLG
jgi:argininosuccinate lyase